MQENEIDVTNVQEKGLVGKIKSWSYENWQTILIILIVLIVGVSAYNYNQQGKNNADNSESVALLNGESENDSADSDNKEDASDEQGESNAELDIVNDSREVEIENADEEKAENEDNEMESANNESEEETALSSDSDASGRIYTATAKSGDGITHLARRALAKYLEDINNGSELTEEHKIYIEDYIQNKTGNQKLNIGHQETFSENLIQEAVSNANKLSPKSLENLSKYTKNIG